MTPILNSDMQARSGYASDAAREAFLSLPNDIKLVPTFHAMRLRQRELAWGKREYYTQQARMDTLYIFANQFTHYGNQFTPYGGY